MAVAEDKYAQLDSLLEKTSVYSQFLAERLRERSETEQTGQKRKCRNVDNDGAKRLKSLVDGAVDEDRDVRRTDVVNSNFQQPKLLTGAKLRSYQLAGVEWMISLFDNGINGILADEMGLGKTLQAIGFLCYLREKGLVGPFLIVGPLSVIASWEAEFKKCAPSVPVMQYYGPPNRRKSLRKRIPRQVQRDYPVVVTTYEMVIRDRQHLSRIPWKYIIVDEAHRIKNFECKLLKELKSYSSANRLLLTGTPLQNNLAELWSLLNFLLPEVFDDLSSFQSWFDFENSSDVGEEALTREREARVVSKLHNILRPFLLRRLKVDVEQYLPSKKEIILYTPLSPLQEKYYSAARNGSLHEILDKSGLRAGSGKLQNRLMQLRKACAHPYLFEELDTDEKGGSETTEDIVAAASKLSLVDRLLRRLLPRGHKILLFSQFTTMLDIFEDYLTLRKYPYCRIDGSTALEDRTAQMNSFNSETSNTNIFLLSTRAGGLGVTLVAADTVIFYDSDFNPQVDLQAMDRCHRIGQTRPVHVYRLTCSGTAEELLLRRATEKRKLERVVVGKGKFHKLSFDMQDEDDSGQTWAKDVVSYQPDEEKVGYRRKAITDEELDKLISLRSAPRDETGSATSRITDDGALDGDNFEMYDIKPSTAIFQ